MVLLATDVHGFSYTDFFLIRVLKIRVHPWLIPPLCQTPRDSNVLVQAVEAVVMNLDLTRSKCKSDF